ncbi:MAG: BspA family leucine-rich repeat surface protein [Coriobacteriales bacterium]|jgi:pilin isopeptide linkage protein/uncharacterized repeat protein (TIGR02543 family)
MSAPWPNDIQKVVVKDKVKTKSVDGWFSYKTNLESIEGLGNLDTSEVTDMQGMFAGDPKLTTLDVTGLDTSNVTNMQAMFANWNMTDGFVTITGLDTLDTSKVENMAGMFFGQTKLESADVSKFDTSNVTDMASMFNGCRSIEKLDVSTWDTSNVTNMSGVFFLGGQSNDGTYTFLTNTSLKELDVSGWDTSKVQYMAFMFGGAAGVEKLDVSSFDTSKVEYFYGMFENCQSLKSLDVSNFDLSNCDSWGLEGMFMNCSGVETLDLHGWDTSNINDFYWLFYECSSLKKIIGIEDLDTSRVNTMKQMFYGDKSLETLNLGGWDTRNSGYGCNMDQMFEGTDSLRSVTLGGNWLFNGETSQLPGAGPVYPTDNWRHTSDDLVKTNIELRDGYADNVNDWAGTWVRDKAEHSVTFDANGGIGSMVSQAIEDGSVTLNPSTFTRLGYRFASWNTSADGSGTSYKDRATISDLTDDVTLYAQWEKNESPASDGYITITLKAGEKAVFDDMPSGARYQVVESSAPGWTLESSDGATGTISSTSGKASFVNKYTKDSASVSLVANKDLNGELPYDGLDPEFKFALYEGDTASGEPLQTVTSTHGSAIFNPITYTYDAESWGEETTKTYQYTIAEVLPEDDDSSTDGVQKDRITYDEHLEHVTVTATYDPDTQTMSTSTAYAEDDTPGKANFSNTSPDSEIVIAKTANAQTEATADKDFEFKVTLARDGKALDGEYQWTSTDGTTGTVSNGGTVKVRGGQKATITGLPQRTAYTVTEVDPGGTWEQTASSGTTGTLPAGGIANASFTNDYHATGSVTLAGSKQLEVNGKASDDYGKGDYQFALYQGTDTSATPLQVVSNGAPKSNGTSSFEFAPISYTMADLANGDGTYAKTKDITYTISEVLPDDSEPGTEGVQKNGITYDSTSWTVTVTLTDEGNGTISAAVASSNGSKSATGAEKAAAFENTLTTASVSLTGTKTLTNGKLSKGQFSFMLTDEQGTTTTLKNGADGKIKLPIWTYTEPGTHTYQISEVNDKQDGITYDGTTYKITVTTTRDATGKLVASTSVSNGTSEVGADGISFVNKTKIDLPIADGQSKTSTKADEKSSTPDTGDKAPLTLVVITIAAAGIALLLERRHRKARNE